LDISTYQVSLYKGFSDRMFFKIIDKYILKELFKLFVISAGALTTILYLDKFLFMAEMIVNRGVTSMEMVMMMTYISPAFLALTIPIAVLLASVITFNQFSANNEWIAMKSCNWSFLQLMKPVACFAVMAYILANIIMFWAIPWGNQSYKILIYDIIKNRANVDIKPNVFNKGFKDLIIVVKERNQKFLLKGVFIADNSHVDSPQIITSNKGIIYANPETLKIQLKLTDGTIHKLSKDRGIYQTINFDRYDITLNLPGAQKVEHTKIGKKALVGNKELSLAKIRERIQDLKKKGLPTSGAEVEISKKFSLPFTCLLFAFFGAPLGVKSRRSGKSGSFGITILVILLYYIALIMTQNLGRIGELHAYTSVWIPNFILLILVIYSSYKMQIEKPFKALDKITDLIITLYELSTGFFKKSVKTNISSKKAKDKTASLKAIAELRKEDTHKK
jgi:lipopolysaccharide export system permease protein